MAHHCSRPEKSAYIPSAERRRCGHTDIGTEALHKAGGVDEVEKDGSHCSLPCDNLGITWSDNAREDEALE
jgi:hypothetical protein